MAENEMVFYKTYRCPVCDGQFKNLTVKQGKARLLGTDIDLKPNFADIETLKYDVCLCPVCGYASVERYFGKISAFQRKQILENISKSFKTVFPQNDTISFDEAVIRYKFAILTCQVKGSKESEFGFLCLKLGWLYRAYAASLNPSEDESKIKELNKQEDAFLLKAMDYFVVARANEQSPICGMDEMTYDCLLAALMIRFERFSDAKRLLGSVITSRTASKRVKDKARELKDIIMEKAGDDEEDDE